VSHERMKKPYMVRMDGRNMMKWHLQVQSQEDAYQNKPSVTFKLQPDNGRDVILITTSQSN